MVDVYFCDHDDKNDDNYRKRGREGVSELQ